MSQSPSQHPEITSRVGAILRATGGNFLEMFDFFLFGFYATYIAKAFFPTENEVNGLLLTFTTFWLGALMRPVGAIVLGAYIDRIGRRKGLIVTLAIMALGTVFIAVTPTYASIGIAAPIIVLIGRLLQGFSAGVELGGVSIYLFEIATPGNKGFYTSFQSASQQVAIFFAAIIGFAMSASLTSQQIADGGWRIPFFIGCLIVPFIFVLRRSLQETPEFLSQKKHPTTAEIFRSMTANWPIVLLGMLLVVLTTVTFYLITVYTPTFGKSVLKLTESESLLVTLCVATTNFFWLPVGGAISDRAGRKAVLLTIAILAFATAYPCLQRGDGGGAVGAGAETCACDLLLPGLQPGGGVVRHRHSAGVDLVDQYDRGQGFAGILADGGGPVRDSFNLGALSRPGRRNGRPRLAARPATAG